MQRTFTGQEPTLAQIGGHMLNSTFIDSLESDIELLERLNQFSHFRPADSTTLMIGDRKHDLIGARSNGLDSA
ncbi:HAD hydrolase-like protein, partial [Klebsiella pneumoniae]|uniref:HAD hydrolase-like protein n=1 Tax=Klebsiella pneumoniae TaxID=573 RepID=UPI0027304546